MSIIILISGLCGLWMLKYTIYDHTQSNQPIELRYWDLSLTVHVRAPIWPMWAANFQTISEILKQNINGFQYKKRQTKVMGMGYCIHNVHCPGYNAKYCRLSINNWSIYVSFTNTLQPFIMHFYNPLILQQGVSWGRGACTRLRVLDLILPYLKTAL